MGKIRIRPIPESRAPRPGASTASPSPSSTASTSGPTPPTRPVRVKPYLDDSAHVKKEA
jgi:hypothetical protein